MSEIIARTCAACSGLFSGHAGRTTDEPFFCPRCTERRMAGFDPKPGDMVMHVDRQAGPWSSLLVRDRTGITITAWPVGIDLETAGRLNLRVIYHVNELVPRNGYGRS